MYLLGPQPIENHFFLSIGDSPYAASIISGSPVNLYALSSATRTMTFVKGNGAFNLAYDDDHQVLYGILFNGLAT